jgi:hypothetical protein
MSTDQGGDADDIDLRLPLSDKRATQTRASALILFDLSERQSVNLRKTAHASQKGTPRRD